MRYSEQIKPISYLKANMAEDGKTYRIRLPYDYYSKWRS